MRKLNEKLVLFAEKTCKRDRKNKSETTPGFAAQRSAVNWAPLYSDWPAALVSVFLLASPLGSALRLALAHWGCRQDPHFAPPTEGWRFLRRRLPEIHVANIGQMPYQHNHTRLNKRYLDFLPAESCCWPTVLRFSHIRNISSGAPPGWLLPWT